MRFFLILYLGYLGTLLETHWDIEVGFENPIVAVGFGVATMVAAAQDIKELFKSKQ